jgi:DNA replication protein DnaC
MFTKIKGEIRWAGMVVNDTNPDNRIYTSLVKASGIPELTHDSLRFNKYDLKKGDQNAYLACMALVDINADGIWVFSEDKLANDWKHDIKFLTLFSNTGRGKTHLAISAGWEVLDSYLKLKYRNPDDAISNCAVIYRQVGSLMNELRRGYEDNSFAEVLNDCKECRLLILDDLGAEKSSDWTWATLDEIIDWRYINELDTIVTTNVTASSLSPRIASRLMDARISKIITMKNEDYRRIQQEKN